MPTTRSGCAQTVAIFVIGMPEVFDARTASSATCFSNSAKISCFSSSFSGTASSTKSAPSSAAARSVSKRSDPPSSARRLEPIEHALGHRHAALGPLERLLGADVVERRLDSRPGEHRAHARAHRPGADHRCASYLGHVPSSFSSWIRRQTRSGVSGSSCHGNAGVGDSRGNRRGDGGERALAAALGPVRPGPVLVLDDDAVHLLGEVLERRDPVVEQGLVQQQPVLVDHLLVERVAEALQRAALVLALDELRVDRAARRRRRSPSSATRTRPVSSSIATSAAPTHTSQKTGPLRVGARALGRDLAAPDQLAAGEPEVADEELRDRSRTRRPRSLRSRRAAREPARRRA